MAVYAVERGIDGDAAYLDLAVAHNGFVEEGVQVHFHHGVYLARVGVKIGSAVHDAHHRLHVEIAGRNKQFRELPQHRDVLHPNANFLLRFAEGGLGQVTVGAFHAPTRKRHLPGVNAIVLWAKNQG